MHYKNNKVTKETQEILPPLSPITHDWMATFLDKKADINALFEQYGSPINVHHASPFFENIADFTQSFQELKLKNTIYFARKANKCNTLVSLASQQNIGVDTASLQELEDCLEAGIDPQKIVITAAVKTRPLMHCAVKNQVPVMLDNDDEVALLKEVCKDLDKQIAIGIRISGFEFEGKPLPSRFGYSLKDAYALICQLKNENTDLIFKGFHFHLNGYSTAQRAAALQQTISLADELKNEGIETEFIDMGGGILINYLKQQSEWLQFHTTLKAAVLNKVGPITYENDALGMVLIDGQLHGEPQVYPYYNDNYKTIFLEKVLKSGFSEEEKIYEALNSRQIEIRIEPGRALLDQVGITMARVCFRKTNAKNELLVGLEMNRTQLRSSSADFLLDPVFISTKEEKLESEASCSGFLVGAYCLEQELILKRKITFSKFPEIGDVIAFVNTAGYMMHFYESQAHLFDLATNLFINENGTYSKDKY